MTSFCVQYSRKHGATITKPKAALQNTFCTLLKKKDEIKKNGCLCMLAFNIGIKLILVVFSFHPPSSLSRSSKFWLVKLFLPVFFSYAP